ncbi:MAG: methyltransferase, partial [Ruthenibacterium sp.]
MGRREDFNRTMQHQKPENLIIDFGGNPLSSMEGESENKLLDFLGFGEKEGKDLPFGKTRRLDHRLLEYFDIDTRSVGEIFVPQDSMFEKISDSEYIDEWGIRRKFTGMYWESINTPLKGATLAELNAYRFPDPMSIDPKQIAAHAARAKELYENTDYVICA